MADSNTNVKVSKVGLVLSADVPRGQWSLHCTKNHIFFSKRFEKMVFQKKSRWKMISLVLSEKMIFLFSQKYHLIP